MVLIFHPLVLPTPTFHIQSSLHPIVFVHGSFIHVPWWPFPFFAPLSASPVPSGSCQFVLYFHVSGSILLVCLFCWLGSTHRWWDHLVIIWYLSFTTWLISFSIIVSSSMQAVMEGRIKTYFLFLFFSCTWNSTLYSFQVYRDTSNWVILVNSSFSPVWEERQASATLPSALQEARPGDKHNNLLR